jgi:transposase
MEDTNRSARRYHALELKKAVLDECRAGSSVASVAMAHGLNANLVHKWRRCEQGKVVAATTTPIPAQTFIPLAITSPAAPPPPAPITPIAPTPPASAESRELRIELRRGAIVATVNWPMSASAECAGWLRELLR